MKKIIICPNEKRDIDMQLTGELEKLLRGLGADVKITPFFESAPGGSAARAFGSDLDDADCVICLGGDGTILHISKATAKANVPLLGINLGTIGFLAGLERDEWQEAARVVTDNCTVEHRMMLDVRVYRDGEEKVSETVLNDAVIERGAEEHMVHITARSDGREMCSFAGDGIIFSTPTGSTGYSMSAGGPVVEPEAEDFLMTPICAHTLPNQVFVLAPTRVLTAELIGAEERSARLMVDGKNAFSLRNGDVVRVTRSEYVTKLVRIKDRDFYTLVNRKLTMKL